ncbi:hypothetical protein HDU97_010153 [Phlyctochytrium planicorne]|nr:hypothetical protein HDU97_010153 [Phlyctochytrium planicorne]
MDRRKEELEKKRLKLAELRKAREERRTALGEVQKRDINEVASREKQEVDDLITSLVGERKSETSSPKPAAAEIIASVETNAGSKSTVTEQVLPTTTEPEKEIPPKELVAAEFVLFDLQPKERLQYSKESQTDFLPEEEEEKPETAPIESKKAIETDHEEAEIAENQESEQLKIKDEERKTILHSDSFVHFFDYSSKLIERALNEKYDILRDYTLGNDTNQETNTGKGVKHLCSFYDEKLSKNRAITDVHWSPKYSELLLCSYNKNQVAVNEANGLVLVWNLHLTERPEFVFQSQSDVLTARFSDFHPNLIIGGTYSGQIVLWDTRSKSLPVLKTPWSAVGHTHPVYSMSMVGTQNAHNIITASTDGLVCSWTLDMLAQPQEMLDLVNAKSQKTDEVAVTTLAFPSNETSTFWVGTEEGSIFQANRYDRAGSKAGINNLDVYKGHFGMITGMHFHPLSGPIDFSDLFLTSSVDWTVKLWRAKSLSKASVTEQVVYPVCSFEEADDYVYDVKWSPVHPSLFALIDGGGRFDVYDLNLDTEVPIASTIVGSGKALNKLDWDKEGKKVAIGSSDAHCHVYDLGEISQPQPEAWNQFQRVVGEMVSNQQK